MSFLRCWEPQLQSRDCNGQNQKLLSIQVRVLGRCTVTCSSFPGGVTAGRRWVKGGTRAIGGVLMNCRGFQPGCVSVAGQALVLLRAAMAKASSPAPCPGSQWCASHQHCCRGAQLPGALERGVWRGVTNFILVTFVRLKLVGFGWSTSSYLWVMTYFISI